MKLFNRIWQLVIKTDKIQKVYNHLKVDENCIRIEFSSDSSVNRVPNNGEITLYNISTSDIAALSTDYKKDTATMNPSVVELQAGYDDSMGIVLYGSIYEAIGNFQPNVNNIKLRIMNNTPTDQSNYFVLSLANNTTFKDVCAEIANKTKLKLDYDTRVENRVLQDFSFAGNLTQQIQNLRSLYSDIDIFIDKKVLRIKSRKFYHKEIIEKKKTVKDKKGKKIVTTTKIEKKRDMYKIYSITESTGLIGSPIPNPQGCIIQTYLIPFIYASDFIELKSVKIPNLNGYYRVQTIKHRGSSHSDDWFSELQCIRV